MFQVDIKKNDTTATYFVWDSGELIETRSTHLDGYFAIDRLKNVDVNIVPANNRLCIVMRHLSPVMISLEECEAYIKMLNSGFDKTMDFMPCHEITVEDYDMLYNLYIKQEHSKEEKEKKNIDDTLEYVKKYVKTR
ncbi:MAG: hypothetical protein IKE75_02145 [Bacilli bacterium]|nr:hypothetical protein [Bacilli bacterium]